VEALQHALDVFLHLDVHLNEWATMFGPWLYLILFLILFCETGLVVTPFLPGDSLLFATGALASWRDRPSSFTG
jgi:membrane-associated protein